MTDAMQAVPQRRPWLAAVLSALIPGAGQAYAGRWGRAAVWFAPAMLALIGLFPAACYAIGTVLFARFSLNEREHAELVRELRARAGRSDA